MTNDGSARALVVGLGSMDRGDDAVGPAVAAGVRDLVSAGVRAAGDVGNPLVVDHEDPTALIDLMDDRDVVVIIDAIVSGAAPGSVLVRLVGPGDAPLPARTDPGPAGTHGLGLATAIELARALDRLPSRVAIVGVEAIGFEPGQPLSAPVRAAVPRAVEAVLALLRTGGPVGT